MAQGENAIPIAKMLTPGGAEPWRFVTPLGHEWWAGMTPLEQAHREHRLLCPHCHRHLLYCCGEVVVPYPASGRVLPDERIRRRRLSAAHTRPGSDDSLPPGASAARAAAGRYPHR